VSAKKNKAQKKKFDGMTLGKIAHSDGHNNVCKNRGVLISEGKTYLVNEEFLTLMALEDLHDFPTLQIPQVDLAVFAARHDPLASGDAEAGADAVLGVLVADVRL
jgi:hypothetical protein